MLRSTTGLPLLCLAAALIAALLLSGCGDDDKPTPTNNGDVTNNGTDNNNVTDNNVGTSNNDVGRCTEGFVGCGCIAGIACYPGSAWICVDGMCQQPDCAEGSLHCACYANGTCDALNGAPLRCGDDGICEKPACPAGTMGCECTSQGLCEAGLECSVEDGTTLCGPPGCPTGADGCSCRANRTCNDGLFCRDSRCTASTCQAGRVGCACRADFGCDPGMTCNADEICEEVTCTPGAIGCICDAGSCRADNTYCDPADRCQRIDCPEGEEGCACSAESMCGFDGTGARLTCEAGVCRSDRCTPGEGGCVCENGWSCADGTCVDGYCQSTACVAGTEDCGCVGGACGPNLICANGSICRENTGYVSGACFDNGACLPGGRCNRGTCVACLLGRIGCACDDGRCATGAACVAGQCISEMDVQPDPPEAPLCYSPCRADLVENSVVRRCNSDGLMEGCIDGRTCDDGCCVADGEPGCQCQSDNDCPEFQRCLSGQCYSNCESDGDCSSGQGCHMHVCRFTCSTVGEPCPSGYACDAEDGDQGFCVPSGITDGTASSTSVDANFSIDVSSLTLTNTSVTGSFTITNHSDLFREYTIRKKTHLVTDAQGGTERATRTNDGKIICDADTSVDPDFTEATHCSAACADPMAPADSCTCEHPTCFCSVDADCVDGAFRCADGVCRPATCGAGECPMFWLDIGRRGATRRVQDFTVGIEPNSAVRIEVGNSDGSPGVRWTGQLEISNDEAGTQLLPLNYFELPEGQWGGDMVYLSSFGTNRLDEWVALPNPPPGSFPAGNDNPWLGTRDDSNEQRRVGNALIQRWGAFRRGRISWDEFTAVLMATRNESWKWSNVQRDCTGIAPNGACYLYDDNTLGLKSFTSDLATTPVPSGAIELPIVMNLRVSGGNNLSGRIVSSESLQFAGDPSVDLTFDASPNSCSRDSLGACLVFVEDLQADIFIGGRYATVADDFDCGAERPGDGFVQQRTPWLIPGFEAGIRQDPETGQSYQYHCRDAGLPFVAGEGDDAAAFARENFSLALSNPIPDARARERSLTVVDGALINQSTLFVLFREHFDSFLGTNDPEGFNAYGYMLLTKQPTDIAADDLNANDIPDAYEGSHATDTRTEPTDVLAVSCDPTLLSQIFEATRSGGGPSYTNLNNAGAATAVVRAILEGTTSPMAAMIGPSSPEEVHYLCHDTGQFDGGAGANDSPSVAIPCPVESEVEYFTVRKADLPRAAVVDHLCQTDPGTSCLSVLQTWRANGRVVQESDCMDADPTDGVDACAGRNLVWRCKTANEVYCDDNRLDLTAAKDFYEQSGSGVALFVPLQAEIDDAFRYKTRFRSQRGTNLGFAPDICIPNSDQTPYCYAPQLIESINQRVDCLLNILDQHSAQLAPATAVALNDYLDFNFAYEEQWTQNGVDLTLPIVHDGFEFLFSELMITLGDESYTRAFASRFDLAGNATVSFEGSAFEDGGPNLSGIVGYELYSLYQAVQYYDEALDRFYSYSPMIWDSIQQGADDKNFISNETVTRYFKKLIRASTQKSKAWAQVARKYKDLNKPELARRVSSRAYTATYLESVVMNRMLLRIIDFASAADRAEVESAVIDAARSYRAALLDMADVHGAIDDNLTIFGFAPDYIPFPALDSEDFRQSNAFELLQVRAQAKVDFARIREERALDSNRSFQTSQAEFQSELTQIKNTYENQLGDLCGTFAGQDNRIYPAIEKYAYLDERASIFGDPCGMMGNGELHNAIAGLEDLRLDVQQNIVQSQNVLKEIDIERERVAAQCGVIAEQISFEYGDNCGQFVERADCDPDADANCHCITILGNTRDNEFASRRSRIHLCYDRASVTCDPQTDSNCDCDARGCTFDDNTLYTSCLRGVNGETLSLRKTIQNSQFNITRMNSALGFLGQVSSLSACTFGLSDSCSSSAIALGVYVAGFATLESGIAETERDIDIKEAEIGQLEARRGAWNLRQQCDFANIDSEARVKTMALRLEELYLEGLRLEYRTRVAQADIQRLRQRATRLQMEQKETEQLSINVQAARNDPNVRIYRNDSIINAEVAFEDAIKEVYRLTRIFEYYTSSSYAHKDDLFLVRMVSYGDPNLENYLSELGNTFYDFEELFGNPQSRVLQLSLRDDIFAIPLYDEQGNTMSRDARTRMLRDRLADVALLDEKGYITIPFSTRVESFSPLTRNHKLLFIEANIDASDFGDHVARVYVRQRGTGVVHTIDDTRNFYRFDDKTSVINASFNGTKYFTSGNIYPNYRLRDRPVANTQYELVINQRNEEVNQDINLRSVTDIKLFFYYSDLTTF